MDFLDLPIETQKKIAELDSMTLEEYIKELEYLENETLEQFENRIANTPESGYWTEENKKRFINKMSVNPQKMD